MNSRSFANLVLISLMYLVVPAAAFSQTLTPVGSENTLDIATWNIEWFGSTNEQPSNDALQLANAKKVIEESGIDLWGVQEIASTSAFESLLSELGSNYDGRLATNSGTQRVGFIYNTDVIRLRQIRHVLESSEFEFAFRPPLQMEVDVMLPDTTVIMTFITLHMKAFADQSSYDRRTAASSRLKNHIDFTTLASKPVVVLGDFNDELTQSIFANRTTPFDNFLQDPGNFSFLSYPLEMEGEGSFCSNSSCSSRRSIVDHILITNELFTEVEVSQPAGVLDEVTDVINLFGSSTSDHVPVFARFSFNGGTVSSTEATDLPDQFTLQSPYPNPFSSRATLTYALHTPSKVQLDVFDIMGRKVWSQDRGYVPPGSYEEHINLDRHASGTYLLRVRIDDQMKTFPLVFAAK